ncbi:MAG: RNA polymerase sigma factor [Bacteroidota bacterium]
MNNHPHEAFLKWYEPVHEQFVRYCSSRAFGLMETEDLVQESILQTLQAFYRIEDKQRLLGFMVGVANNLVRQQKRRMKFKGQWDENALEKLEARTNSPEVALDIHYLLKALQQLKDKQREALVLFEISGFKIKEISEIQDCSEGAVKTRLSRARQQLKKLLQEDGRPMPLTQRLAIYASVLF